jgi:hypothetical protein
MREGIKGLETLKIIADAIIALSIIVMLVLVVLRVSYTNGKPNCFVVTCWLEATEPDLNG